MMKLKEEDMALNVQQDNVSRHAEALQKREREYEVFLLEIVNNKQKQKLCYQGVEHEIYIIL